MILIVRSVRLRSPVLVLIPFDHVWSVNVTSACNYALHAVLLLELRGDYDSGKW